MPQSDGARTPHHRIKLAVVGGGSTYTPELIDGFARLRDVLPSKNSSSSTRRATAWN